MLTLIKHTRRILMHDNMGYGEYGRRLLFMTVSVALIGILTYHFVWQPHITIAHNVSTSLKPHYFLVIKGQRIHRGNYVAFYPPTHNPLYGDKTPFLKIIGGVPGDRVSRIGRMFYVNHHKRGWAFKRAHNGLRLHLGPTGIIGQGKYYVYTPNPKSYDSRYASIGWIAARRLIGRAYPLF